MTGGEGETGVRRGGACRDQGRNQFPGRLDKNTGSSRRQQAGRKGEERFLTGEGSEEKEINQGKSVHGRTTPREREVTGNSKKWGEIS